VEDRISNIKARLDLASLFEAELGPPAAARLGKGWWHCPLPGHQAGDRHPSLSADQRRWTCWSGAHEPSRGDVLDWLRARHGLSLPAAVDRAADLAGGAPVTRPRSSCSRVPLTFSSSPAARPTPPQTRPLTGPAADEALTIFLRDRGWSPSTATALGLAVVRDSHGLTRIRFPFTSADTHGAARLVGDHQRAPRWLLDPGPMPGPYRAENLARPGSVFLTEGVTDAAALLDARPDAAVVGIPGTHALKPAWLPAFRGRQVVVVGDNDTAGQAFARATAEALAPFAASVVILEVPAQHGDLADWRKGAGDHFDSALAAAECRARQELPQTFAEALEAKSHHPAVTEDAGDDEEAQCL
jgi:hypothetical protein